METQKHQILEKIDDAVVRWDIAKIRVQAARDKVYSLNPSINKALKKAEKCLGIIRKLKNFWVNMTVAPPESSDIPSVVNNFKGVNRQLNSFESKYFKLLTCLRNKSDEAGNIMAKLQETRERTLSLRPTIVMDPPQIPLPSPEWLNSVPWGQAQSMETEWEKLDIYHKIFECEEPLQNALEKLELSIRIEEGF